jgi:hypothetical protein
MTKLKHNSEYITLTRNHLKWLGILTKWCESRGVERDYPILIWAHTLDVTINQPYSLCFQVMLNDKYHNIHPNIKLDIKGVCWECKRKEIQSVRLSKKPLQKYKPMKGIIITPMGNNIR